jgi:Protein of unknown function (DUF2637)
MTAEPDTDRPRRLLGLTGMPGRNRHLRRARIRRHRDGDWTSYTETDERPRRDRPARRPGARLLWSAVTLLALLAGVSFFVSYAAQYGFVWAVKHAGSAAAAEGAIPDAGMLICAMLALAMAVQGRSAKVARACVVGFAALSAVMNYEAANSTSAHAITVYVMPPVAFAVCTDLVVSVVRRFYYGIEDTASPWAALGRGIAATARAAARAALYAARLLVDRPGTMAGIKQAILDATPLPGADPAPAATKKAALIALYRKHPDHGDRARVSPVATELAPAAGLQPGTARTYLAAYLTELETTP